MKNIFTRMGLKPKVVPVTKPDGVVECQVYCNDKLVMVYNPKEKKQ